MTLHLVCVLLAASNVIVLQDLTGLDESRPSPTTQRLKLVAPTSSSSRPRISEILMPYRRPTGCYRWVVCMAPERETCREYINIPMGCVTSILLDINEPHVRSERHILRPTSILPPSREPHAHQSTYE